MIGLTVLGLCLFVLGAGMLHHDSVSVGDWDFGFGSLVNDSAIGLAIVALPVGGFMTVVGLAGLLSAA